MGGFAAILPSAIDYEGLILIGGEAGSSSARMELAAVCAVVQHCYKYNGVELTIYSDAEYIVKSFKLGWVFDWMKAGFPNTKNLDIWKDILRGIQSRHISSFQIHHVKGHSGVWLNEVADKWAGWASWNMKELNRNTKKTTFISKIQEGDLRIHKDKVGQDALNRVLHLER
jgi:ribonuclease HI